MRALWTEISVQITKHPWLQDKYRTPGHIAVSRSFVAVRVTIELWMYQQQRWPSRLTSATEISPESKLGPVELVSVSQEERVTLENTKHPTPQHSRVPRTHIRTPAYIHTSELRGTYHNPQVNTGPTHPPTCSHNRKCQCLLIVSCEG